MKKLEDFPELAEFCKKNYPSSKFRTHLIETEMGDVAVVYIHNLDHSFLSGCKIVYYNTWYPGEVNVYNLQMI